MSQPLDSQLVETIVAGVMDRLRGGSVPARPTNANPGNKKTQEVRPADATVVIADRVVTEAVLVERLHDTTTKVQFGNKAVLTPTARDYLRTYGIHWDRGESTDGTYGAGILAVIVSQAPIVKRIVSEQMPGARVELLGCADDAARLAAAEIARGGRESALVFARQSHRVACLANRQSAVRAAAVRDVADVNAVRSQLRTNVWCLDPTGRGSFDLRNLIRAATSQDNGG